MFHGSVREHGARPWSVATAKRHRRVIIDDAAVHQRTPTGTPKNGVHKERYDPLISNCVGGVVDDPGSWRCRPRSRSMASRGARSSRRSRSARGGGATRGKRFAHVHNFPRLPIRYERYPAIHTALLVLACSTLCWRHLKSLRKSFLV